MESLANRIAQATKFDASAVIATLELLDADNTVPFITRYRKEKTGGLDENAIRAIESHAAQFRELDERSCTILRSLEQKGKLTSQLRTQIEAAESIKRLDELYAPFKTKKKTRADEAREMGLGPLADAIWSGKLTPEKLQTVAGTIVGKHPELKSAEVVLQRTADSDCRSDF